MPRVPASATVDDLGSMVYEVHVEGAFDYAGTRRTYVLKATSEDFAAREGLRLFVEEMVDLADFDKG